MPPIVPFGKQFREKYFTSLESSEIVPVNHGLFGLTPDPVFSKYISSMKNDFSFPDRFIRFEQQTEYRNGLKKLGELVNCDYHNLAIVENATTGLNTVLRSIPFKKGDKFVIMSTIYGAIGNTIEFLKNTIGIIPIVVDINYPMDDEEILNTIETIFQNESQIKLCLFDVITSMPGVRFPFENAIELCRKNSVISLIDGAHSIGLIPIDLTELKPDFYTSNLHKWLFVPRGCALLYVNPKYHRQIQSLPISLGYVAEDTPLDELSEKDLLIDKFKYTGTKNFSQTACIETAIDFRQNECGGESEIWNYCHQLSLKVGEFITEKKWPGMKVLNNYKQSLITTMIMIEIPVDQIKSNLKNKGIVNLKEIDMNNSKKMIEFVDLIQYKMVYDYKTFVPVAKHNGKLYARFLCQIYNDLSDYDYASDVVLKVFELFFQSQTNKL